MPLAPRPPAATFATLAAWLAIAVAAIGDPPRLADQPIWAALACAGLGFLGLRRGRVWGLFALVSTSALIAASSPSAWWGVAAVVVALPLVLRFPALFKVDRAAAILSIICFAGAGGAAGLALAGSAGPAQSSRRPTRPPVARPSPGGSPSVIREVQVSIEEVPGQRALRVTFRNPGAESLALDLPKESGSRPFHSPLLEPLLRVEAFDAAGRRLKHIRSSGCGMVYSWTKVVLRVLPPGGTSVHLVDLPDAWYPESAMLPEYSHGMMMNAEEVAAAPRPVHVERTFLRVVYDTAARAGSWRDDLSSGGMGPGTRVRGTSAGIAGPPASAILAGVQSS